MTISVLQVCVCVRQMNKWGVQELVPDKQDGKYGRQ